LENWFKIEFIFAKNLHITPSELDDMEFYRVEYMVMNYEEFIEEENKQMKKQEKDQNMSFKKNQPNTSQYKMPKMQVPKMSVPKM
jgi:hypothetical protein